MIVYHCHVHTSSSGCDFHCSAAWKAAADELQNWNSCQCIDLQKLQGRMMIAVFKHHLSSVTYQFYSTLCHFAIQWYFTFSFHCCVHVTYYHIPTCVCIALLKLEQQNHNICPYGVHSCVIMNIISVQ